MKKIDSISSKETNNKARIQTYVDKDLKLESEEVLNSMGLTINTAITILLNRIVATDSFPLDLKLTEDEKNKISIIKNVRKLPTKNITTKDELKKWLEEDSDEQ